MAALNLKQNDWTPDNLVGHRKWRAKMFSQPELSPKLDPLAAKIEAVADREKAALESKIELVVAQFDMLRSQLQSAWERNAEMEPPPNMPPRPKLAKIIATVCRYYGISLTELNSNRRQASIVRPRHVAMYLCKELTLRSYPEIGRQIGSRDHTTILHAVRKITQLRLTDSVLCQELDELEALFA